MRGRERTPAEGDRLGILTPKVRWQLGTAPCWDGVGDYDVAEIIPTLGVNIGYERRLAPFTIPAAIPPGSYHLCARINPDGDLAELTHVDNRVRSARLFTGKPPASCP